MAFNYKKEYNKFFWIQPAVELQEINLWFV